MGPCKSTHMNKVLAKNSLFPFFLCFYLSPGFLYPVASKLYLQKGCNTKSKHEKIDGLTDW